MLDNSINLEGITPLEQIDCAYKEVPGSLVRKEFIFKSLKDL